VTTFYTYPELTPDSSNQLLVPESPVLQVSDVAERVLRECERLPKPSLGALSRLTVPLAPRRPKLPLVGGGGGLGRREVE
jgi:hypothetical protein